jgi:hypothetical protein
MSTRRWPWIAWAGALVAVVLGLAWQVAYTNGIRDCADTDLLILCAGPLDPWVLSVLVSIAMVLIVIGAWARLSRGR